MLALFNERITDEDILPSTFWDYFNCEAICPSKVSIVGGTKSTGVPNKTLTKGDISQLCDGDHLFGRELHNNGIFRVIGCSHQENITRSAVRYSCNDWLLAGLVGSYALGGDHTPTKSKRRISPL